MGRQVAINFGKNIVFQNNTFNVSDGTLAIQSERWRNHPE